MKKLSNIKNSKIVLLSILVLLVLIIILLLLGKLHVWDYYVKILSTIFVGSSAIFAGLSVIVSTITIWTQKRSILYQQCESTFSQMIIHLNNLTIQIEYGQEWYKGKNVFTDCYNHLRQLYKLEKELTEEQDNDTQKNDNLIDEAIKKMDFESLRSCFEYIIQIFKYIERQKVLNEEEKKEHIELLITQFSTDESVMFFYYCYFYAKVVDSTKDMLNKYNLFNDLQYSNILINPNHCNQIIINNKKH